MEVFGIANHPLRACPLNFQLNGTNFIQLVILSDASSSEALIWPSKNRLGAEFCVIKHGNNARESISFNLVELST